MRAARVRLVVLGGTAIGGVLIQGQSDDGGYMYLFTLIEVWNHIMIFYCSDIDI